jgi:hypothetical protein
MGGAITNMEPAKRGMHTYVDVDDINAAAAPVKELAARPTSRVRCRAWGGSQSVRIQGNDFGLWQNDPLCRGSGRVDPESLQARSKGSEPV